MKQHARLVIIVVALIVVALVLFIILLSGKTSQGSNVESVRSALQTARANWIARPLRHYKLVLQQNTLLHCTIETEVQDERVIAENTKCPSTFRLKTVTDLFDAISSEIATWKDNPIDCFSDEDSNYWFMDVSYDPQWNIPRYAQSRLVDGCAWKHTTLGAPQLARLPLYFEVKSLTPIQSGP